MWSSIFTPEIVNNKIVGKMNHLSNSKRNLCDESSIFALFYFYFFFFLFIFQRRVFCIIFNSSKQFLNFTFVNSQFV